MAIFRSKKKYATIKSTSTVVKETKKKPEKIWENCPGCNDIIYKKDMEENLKVCPNCGHYMRMTARERIELLIDKGTFTYYDEQLETNDPLAFPDYQMKLNKAFTATKAKNAIHSGIGKMNGKEVSFGVMDFSFVGGSMGAVLGEKVLRIFERSLEKRIPAVIVSTSGGARMQEGMLSLMQMAKTSAAVAKMREAGVPFISVPVHPTTGGVTASYAMLGDIIISEPKALIGFAGQRVIEQITKQKLPKGFQLSEFLLDHGMVDVIAERKQLKDTIVKILDNLGF